MAGKILNNFHAYETIRILTLWDQRKVHIEPIEISPQVVHCLAKCKVSSSTFHLIFVYVFHSIMGRGLLWYNLMEFGS